ncbi:MAG: hypothetical protein CMG04_09660 [Candidatus Marinimicrobia bacterium]|nr:hypothetical protein [Candidatus Neomarinimicrobiota bacterium]|tara:strand:+ start:448 stop:945 length:498 start_codon:yes stop_codon:yes gene_type:complete
MGWFVDLYKENYMIAYLSGPIENAHNDGADWRNDITGWLENKLDHEVFNPVIETKSIIEHHNANDFRLMKKTNPNEYKKIIRKIIKVDLNAVVNKSDYLIVKWDKSVFKGGGTHGEITMAHWLKKPIFLVNSLPIDEISSWIFSCSDYMFNNFEDLKKKLEELYS